MTVTFMIIALGIIFLAVISGGVYVLVKQFLKYNSELKSRKTKRAIELGKMHIEDL